MAVRRNISMVLFCGLAVGAAVPRAAADPIRDLPGGYYVPGVAFTVTITLDTPPGTVVAGLEDGPPDGWPVCNISHSGTLDTNTGKVKWGPFFDPSIPASVTYDVRPLGGGPACFSGMASFDTQNESIGGDLCMPGGVPAVSTWGLVILTMLISAAGTHRLRKPAAQAAR